MWSFIEFYESNRPLTVHRGISFPTPHTINELLHDEDRNLKNLRVFLATANRWTRYLRDAVPRNDYTGRNFQNRWKNREILNFERVTACKNNEIFLIDFVRREELDYCTRLCRTRIETTPFSSIIVFDVLYTLKWRKYTTVTEFTILFQEFQKHPQFVQIQTAFWLWEIAHYRSEHTLSQTEGTIQRSR